MGESAEQAPGEEAADPAGAAEAEGAEAEDAAVEDALRELFLQRGAGETAEPHPALISWRGLPGLLLTAFSA